MLFCEDHVFEWQHEFIVYELLSKDLKMCARYIAIYGGDMRSITEFKQKITVFIGCSRIFDAYNIVVSVFCITNAG